VDKTGDRESDADVLKRRNFMFTGFHNSMEFLNQLSDRQFLKKE
jgi:hypothetical protein